MANRVLLGPAVTSPSDYRAQTPDNSFEAEAHQKRKSLSFLNPHSFVDVDLSFNPVYLLPSCSLPISSQSLPVEISQFSEFGEPLFLLRLALGGSLAAKRMLDFNAFTR
ncbi:unnamed protein product [Citrullus colocynthis]|uniref:Uncharacterized protein n=1 Tax=Citrullus colocynthis TaxID=252529 RepID=A0ABP0Z9Q2_9ROSI